MKKHILPLSLAVIIGLSSGCSVTNINNNKSIDKTNIDSIDLTHPNEDIADVEGVSSEGGPDDPQLLYQNENERRVLVRVFTGDNLSSILARSGANEDFLKDLSKKDRDEIAKIYPNDVIEITMDLKGNIKTLAKTVKSVQDKWIVVNKKGKNNYSVSNKIMKATFNEHFAKGTIETNFYNAGEKAKIQPSVLKKFIDIMDPEINIEEKAFKGDEFQIVYRQMQLNERPVGEPVIIAARYIRNGKAYTAYRFQDSSGYTTYYNKNGESLKQGFLKAPLKYVRVSSPFQKKRYHPILHKYRGHLGVDLAAPYGTKVVAPGKGTVSFIGQKGGYGNVLEIQHAGSVKTVYAHLSKFRGGLRKGDVVDQSDTIAYVGTSGLSTGPHLHYEIRINGEPTNPMTASIANKQELDGNDLNKFKKDIERYGRVFKRLGDKNNNKMYTYDWNVEKRNLVI